MTDDAPVLRPYLPPPDGGSTLAREARPPPRPGARLLVRGLAVVLAGCVLFGSVRSLVAGRPPAPEVVSAFGPGTRARVAALRDTLVRGLLSLRMPESDWSPRPTDVDVDPLERREVTALAVAALAAARRMGSTVPTLDEAILSGKAELFRLRRRGRGSEAPVVNPSRNLSIRGMACAILAMSLAADPGDVAKWPLAVDTLLRLTEPGPPVAGWAHGVAARAYGEILESGRGALLGPDPRSKVPLRVAQSQRDCHDPRVAAALASVFRGAYDPAGAAPPEILGVCLESPLEWGGEQTDLRSWLMRAWLAARLPGGDRWFQQALPLLEGAVDPSGVIPGAYYGDPPSRTACALLILCEGERAAHGPR